MSIHHIDTKHSGNVALITEDTHISKWVQEHGRLSHDRDMLSRITRFIPIGSTVVDIGAFIGDHTEYYALCVGNTGKVVAIEPNPEAFQCLQYNMKRFDNVSCHNLAISHKDGTMGLAILENSGASYATQEGDISTVTLDSLCLESCDFIKIDCEGMEPSVLAGGRKTIKEHRPTMLIEINVGALERQQWSTDDLFYQLTTLGYTWFSVYPELGKGDPQYDIVARPTPK